MSLTSFPLSHAVGRGHECAAEGGGSYRMKVKQRWTKSKALLGKGSTQQEKAPPLDWDWLPWQFREGFEEGDSEGG